MVDPPPDAATIGGTTDRGQAGGWHIDRRAGESRGTIKTPGSRCFASRGDSNRREVNVRKGAC